MSDNKSTATDSTNGKEKETLAGKEKETLALQSLTKMDGIIKSHESWRKTVRDWIFILVLLSVAFSTTLAVASIWGFTNNDKAIKMHMTTGVIFTGGVVTSVLLAVDNCRPNFSIL